MGLKAAAQAHRLQVQTGHCSRNEVPFRPQLSLRGWTGNHRTRGSLWRHSEYAWDNPGHLIDDTGQMCQLRRRSHTISRQLRVFAIDASRAPLDLGTSHFRDVWQEATARFLPNEA